MDPMEAAEREKLLREEEERKELEQVIGLVDFITDIKELANRGRDVHPSAKNRKDLQNLAKSLRMNVGNRRKLNSIDVEYNDDDLGEFSAGYIDLLTKPRTLLHEGVVTKRDADGRGINISFKSSLRYLFLLSDSLLITYNKDLRLDSIRKLNDMFDLSSVVWMKDLRLHDVTSHGNDNEHVFELIVSQTRFRDQYSIQFACDIKNEWLREISYTLYAYHKDSPMSRQLGWYHLLVVGTLHSAAYTGDLVTLKKIVKSLPTQNEIDVVDKLCALHWAVFNGNEACARYLLENGADADRLQGGMNTPFLFACCRGFDTLARLLLDKGADLHARNVKNCDAVVMAVVYGHACSPLKVLM